MDSRGEGESEYRSGQSYYTEGEEEFPSEYVNDGTYTGNFQENDDKYAERNSHGLNLEWALGFNYKLVNGVINLTREESEGNGYRGQQKTQIIHEVFFVVGHTGVIYNYESKKQRLLQGHCNAITGVAYNHAKRILITADKGPDSLLVVWDVNSGTPKKCIFNPHPNGVECLDVSEDGEMILTLSREDKRKSKKSGKKGNRRVEGCKSQTIRVWKWELEEDQCINSGVLKEETPNEDISYQNFIQFNYENPHEFVTTGEERVYFWKMEFDEGICSYYSPQTNDSSGGAKKQSGHSKRFTQTVFVPNSTQAVSGTQEGSLVVWDISLIMEEMSQPDQKREIKTIKLMNDSTMNESSEVGISVLKASQVLLIVGATNGNVRFYDYQFRIVGWFEEKANLAEITSISLSNENFDFEEYERKLNPEKYEGKEKDQNRKAEHEHEFDYPDFIVVDKRAKIVLMKAEEFKGLSEDGQQGEVLIQSFPSKVTSISARPNSSTVAIACSDGRVYKWEFNKKEHILENLNDIKDEEDDSDDEKDSDDYENDYNNHKNDAENDDEESIKKKKKQPVGPYGTYGPYCLKYSPDGKYLAVASIKQNVYVYNVIKGKWQKNPILISQKKENVQGIDIEFSSDSKYFIIMDNYSSITLFKLDVSDNNPDDADWIFYGKLKSHFTDINGICFGEMVDPTDDNSKLKHKFFSIGKDKFLFQYDLELKKNYELNVFSYSKIERETVPTACIWYPVNYLKEQMIMVATDDYKIKLWNVAKKKPICRETFLGPVYGDPINKFIYLNVYNREDQNVPKYVAYTTKKKIVGIIKLPLDGNPNKFMGMIAHPGEISCATSTSDGKFLFTSGADDVGTINMWRVNYSVLEDNDTAGQEENHNPLDTYPNLLEGGKEGQKYRDLKDFFYYAQISSSTENPTKAKKLDGKIPSTIVQNLMRALGYYPTRNEIQNMQHEVIYSKLLETGDHVDNLELQTFVRMYLNHRPVYGLTLDMVKDKMSVLSKANFKDSENDKKDADQSKRNTDGGLESKVKERAKNAAIERGEIRGDQFLKYLMEYGEKMDLEEINASLKNLIGNPELLPEILNSQFIIENLLGFELEDEGNLAEEDDDDIEGDDEFSEDGVSVHHN